MFNNTTKNNQPNQKSGTGVGSLGLSLCVAIYLCLFCLASPVHADFVVTGDVSPTDPTTWTSGTRAYVGRTGSGTLSMTNGEQVVSHECYTGYDFGSTGNVTVDGFGSMWTNEMRLYIGFFGSGALNITNGGEASSSTSYIGYHSGSAGVVTVDGTGSNWTNWRLDIGGYSSGTLNITNGGSVTGGDIWLSRNPDSSGTIHFDSGTLTASSIFCDPDDLTGTGTINTNGLVSDLDLVFDATHGLNQTFVINDNPGQNITFNLTTDNSRYRSMGAGYNGVGTMSISDGIAIESFSGYIGYNSGSKGTVTVDGIGSSWTTDVDLYLGNQNHTKSGSGILNITNGGAVTVLRNMWVSRSTISSSTIHFNNGTLTTGTLFCDSDDLTGTGTINTNGLISDVDLVFDAMHGPNQTVVINDNPDQNITVNLNMNGTGSMGAGYGGTGTINISDGIVVESAGGYIGYKSGSAGTVTVDGVGSTWTNSKDFYIGYSGNGTLNITNGGTVHSVTRSATIGYNSSSTGEVTVDGTGSTWNSKYLSVGNHGSGKLTISNGGTVIAEKGYIGQWNGLTGEVMVDGTGSTWTNNSELRVGDYGSGTLKIINGGEVTVGGDTWVSRNADASGTIHFDNGTLTTGSFIGVSDTLIGTGIINTSGLVSDVDLIFDATHGLNQTFVINEKPGQNIFVNLNIDGSGSMGAGYKGTGTINISDGKVIESTDGYIGYQSDSTGEITVDGTGSAWMNSANLYVGYFGSGTLNITDGGVVGNNNGYIGNRTDSTGKVTVDGVGSTWTSNYLYIGKGGSGTLAITNGGTVINSFGYIGNSYGETGEVTVNGIGSTWINNSDLHVGESGSGTLNIIDGGEVTVKGDTWISSGSYSSGTIQFDNGTLTTGGLFGVFADLAGTGTINTSGLVIDGDLVFDATHGPNQTFVINDNPGQNITVNLNIDGSGSMGAGYEGNGTINISDGRVIQSTKGYIGYGRESTGAITVDGVGSALIQSDDLYVGYYGNGTLNITNGGAVSNHSVTLGFWVRSMGEVRVDGVGSNWETYSLRMGERGGSGLLSITNGGVVSSSSVNFFGRNSDSRGKITVDGVGSIWKIGEITFGSDGRGTLDITNGGLVRLGRKLTISQGDNGNSFINMASGGMLAMRRYAIDSLDDFLDLVNGSDKIRYWDVAAFGWADITEATFGEDYTLSMGTGTLSGFSILTVLAEVPVLGDVNGDGLVDGFDVGSFVDVLLNGPYVVEADANQDGVVNGFDVDPFVALLLGKSIGDGASGVEVPEPMTLVLMVGGVVVLTSRARKEAVGSTRLAWRD